MSSLTLVLLLCSITSSNMCSQYDFYVYDAVTRETIPGAVVSITYKSLDWVPEEARSWSDTTVSGNVNTEGCATIYCLDLNHFGLFDLESSEGNYHFGPYAEVGMVIDRIECSAEGYRTMILEDGTDFGNNASNVRAGGSIGEGTTLYMNPEGLGGSADVSNSTNLPCGTWAGTMRNLSNSTSCTLVIDFTAGTAESGHHASTGLIEDVTENGLVIDFPGGGKFHFDYEIRLGVLEATGYSRAHSNGRIQNREITLEPAW